MSHQEFDQFLSLLSGLLRLSSSQREAIASELRDHLEERLMELLSQGVPRHKAIETALEEFGDTVGLAGEFVQIFQKQRRRWMMRMTLTTAAGIAVLVMLTTAFWPQGRSGASLETVVAQDLVNQEGPAPTDEDVASDAVQTRDAADKFAGIQLRTRLDVEFLDTPIVEALDHLCSQIGLQFYLREKYLDDMGISTDTPVSLTLEQVSAEMVLELIFDQLELTYIIRDGIVLVTTAEDLESMAEVRVYNCRDLLATNAPGRFIGGSQDDAAVVPFGSAMPRVEASGNKTKGGSPPAPAVSPNFRQSNAALVPQHVLAQFGGSSDSGGANSGGGQSGFGIQFSSRGRQLMDIIIAVTVPDSWEDMGGPGTIAEFDGLIVIRHDPRIHRQVDHVLEMLRDAGKEQAWVGQPPSFSAGRGRAGVARPANVGGFF